MLSSPSGFAFSPQWFSQSPLSFARFLCSAVLFICSSIFVPSGAPCSASPAVGFPTAASGIFGSALSSILLAFVSLRPASAALASALHKLVSCARCRV